MSASDRITTRRAGPILSRSNSRSNRKSKDNSGGGSGPQGPILSAEDFSDSTSIRSAAEDRRQDARITRSKSETQSKSSPKPTGKWKSVADIYILATPSKKNQKDKKPEEDNSQPTTSKGTTDSDSTPGAESISQDAEPDGSTREYSSSGRRHRRKSLGKSKCVESNTDSSEDEGWKVVTPRRGIQKKTKSGVQKETSVPERDRSSSQGSDQEDGRPYLLRRRRTTATTRSCSPTCRQRSRSPVDRSSSFNRGPLRQGGRFQRVQQSSRQLDSAVNIGRSLMKSLMDLKKLPPNKNPDCRCKSERPFHTLECWITRFWTRQLQEFMQSNERDTIASPVLLSRAEAVKQLSRLIRTYSQPGDAVELLWDQSPAPKKGKMGRDQMTWTLSDNTRFVITPDAPCCNVFSHQENPAKERSDVFQWCTDSTHWYFRDSPRPSNTPAVETAKNTKRVTFSDQGRNEEVPTMEEEDGKASSSSRTEAMSEYEGTGEVNMETELDENEERHRPEPTYGLPDHDECGNRIFYSRSFCCWDNCFHRLNELCGAPTFDGKITSQEMLKAYKEHHVYDTQSGDVKPLHETNENKLIMETLSEQGMIPYQASIVDDGSVLNILGPIPTEDGDTREGIVISIEDYIKAPDRSYLETITEEDVSLDQTDHYPVQFDDATFIETDHPESWQEVMKADTEEATEDAVKKHSELEQQALNRIKSWLEKSRYTQTAWKQIQSMEEENENFRKRMVDNVTKAALSNTHKREEKIALDSILRWIRGHKTFDAALVNLMKGEWCSSAVYEWGEQADTLDKCRSRVRKHRQTPPQDVMNKIRSWRHTTQSSRPIRIADLQTVITEEPEDVTGLNENPELTTAQQRRALAHTLMSYNDEHMITQKGAPTMAIEVDPTLREDLALHRQHNREAIEELADLNLTELMEKVEYKKTLQLYTSDFGDIPLDDKHLEKVAAKLEADKETKITVADVKQMYKVAAMRHTLRLVTETDPNITNRLVDCCAELLRNEKLIDYMLFLKYRHLAENTEHWTTSMTDHQLRRAIEAVQDLTNYRCNVRVEEHEDTDDQPASTTQIKEYIKSTWELFNDLALEYRRHATVGGLNAILQDYNWSRIWPKEEIMFLSHGKKPDPEYRVPLLVLAHEDPLTDSDLRECMKHIGPHQMIILEPRIQSIGEDGFIENMGRFKADIEGLLKKIILDTTFAGRNTWTFQQAVNNTTNIPKEALDLIYGIPYEADQYNPDLFITVVMGKEADYPGVPMEAYKDEYGDHQREVCEGIVRIKSKSYRILCGRWKDQNRPDKGRYLLSRVECENLGYSWENEFNRPRPEEDSGSETDSSTELTTEQQLFWPQIIHKRKSKAIQELYLEVRCTRYHDRSFYAGTTG